MFDNLPRYVRCAKSNQVDDAGNGAPPGLNTRPAYGQARQRRVVICIRAEDVTRHMNSMSGIKRCFFAELFVMILAHELCKTCYHLCLLGWRQRHDSNRWGVYGWSLSHW